jgi:hypothetical protein
MTNFSISTVHHGLYEDVSKSILSSVLGSLNFRAIAYGRMALRTDALENGQRSPESAGYKRISGDELNIDDRNDADAAIAEAQQRDNAGEDSGFAKQMQPSELAISMMLMREFFADRVYAIGIKSERDKPGTIADTIAFMLTREQDADAQAKMEAIAEALDIDPAMLNAAKLEDETRDRNDLKANVGKIITYLERFEGTLLDEAGLEKLFDELPAQVQYKIIAKVITAYEKQGKFQLVKLTRGNMDAATNYKLLKAKRDEAIVWLNTFSKAKRIELEEYMSRGGELPEYSDTIVNSNDSERQPANNVMVGRANESTLAASARMKEDADAKEAAAIKAAKKSAVRRAPAPVK